MKFEFYKYQGAGNDFVILDDREKEFDEHNHELIAKICHRRFGIGADGLMLLRDHDDYDFEMIYFNADGKEGSMCGNGGRCIVAFAKHLDLFEQSTTFIAVDGEHEAYLIPERDWVSLKMIPVKHIESEKDYVFMDTGSPHYVVPMESGLKDYNVVEEGRKIRYNDRFKEEGTNVNFVEMQGEQLHIRTYERGVEDETYACGTGVTAAVLAMNFKGVLNKTFCPVQAVGGKLAVAFDRSGNSYDNIWLQGPADFVFKGSLNTDQI